MEEIRRDLWKMFRESYITLLRRQNQHPMGSWETPEVGDLVLVGDVPAWSGEGWPVAKIVKIRKGQDGGERLYELEMISAEELKKEPQKINERMRLILGKKAIVRNHRKVGLLPKVTTPMCKKEVESLGREPSVV